MTPEERAQQVARQLRQRSEFSADAVELVQLPEPEARDIPVSDEEAPRGVLAMARAARKAGFETTIRYARGPWQEVGSENYVIKQCIALGGVHPDGRRFRSTWISPNYPRPQKFAFNAAHISTTNWLVKSGDLKDFIAGKESADA